MPTLPITEAERQASRDFMPPPLRRGQPILWFNRAQPHTLPMPGIAVTDNFQPGGQVVNRQSHIVLADGRVIFTCPHMDDPELRWNYNKTVNGGWEYSDYEQHLDEKRQADLFLLMNRIEELQKQVDALTKSTATTAPKGGKTPTK